MRPFLAILGLVLLCVGLAYITTSRSPHTAQDLSGNDTKNTDTEGITDPKNLLSYDKVTKDAIRATLEIEGRGTITLELYPQAAPETVKHFQELCARQFYNGILFHRVKPGFVAQAGDPESKELDPKLIRGLESEEAMKRFNLGATGSGQTVHLEAKLPHKKYSFGLARSGSTDSGDSQFFINLNDNPDLDGKYCAFGRIVQGEEIAAKIEIGDRIKRLSIP